MIKDDPLGVEPVAWMHKQTGEITTGWSFNKDLFDPLYDHPQPKREWVGLTDEEASACWTYNDRTSWRNIEAKLKEKNSG